MKIKLESSKYVFKTNIEKDIFKNKIKMNLDINIDKIEYIQDYEAFQNYN